MAETGNDWTDAAQKHPTDGRSVLGLWAPTHAPPDERAVVMARWDVGKHRWVLIEPAEGRLPLAEAKITHWRDMLPLPEGLKIVHA